MFAIAAFIVFLIGAILDWAKASYTHQWGLLFVGLALLAAAWLFDSYTFAGGRVARRGP